MGERSVPTVALMTVGCKLNQYESEGIAEAFEEGGFEVVPFSERADVYVVNTCTVTGRSDYRSRQMLRRASRRNPSALVVATGCYAQREPGALSSMPEVRLVVGNAEKHAIPGLIAEHLTSGGRPPSDVDVFVSPLRGRSFEAFDIRRFRGHTRAFLKIQDGCDRRCSYCAVPDARGPARSRPFRDVVDQAARLTANGYREIVLTGVHIGSYGADGGGPGLPELLSALEEVPGLARLRLGSVEPNELSPGLAAAILRSDKICRHLHVPLESGSDATLARMGRAYTRSDYAEAVGRITGRDPRAGLGADVMVGFPGETEEHFEETVALIEELPFTYLHVFSFSPRPGTPAAEMGGAVPGVVKKRRSLALRELGHAKSLAFRRTLVGERLEILVEERRGRRGGRLTGLSSNYVRVEIEGDDRLANRLVEVVVESADEEVTRGAALPGTAR
jgi:threonylcarbamoyladenosine tRNA methylthiotransferase MtaB